MFFATIGIVATSGGFPANGTLLSSYCAYATDYDYVGTFWDGYFLAMGVYADGIGGTYESSISQNSSGCWHPSGFVYYSSGGDLYLEWSHGSDIGSFMYGYDYSIQTADGAGGSYYGSGNGLYATEGQVVHSYEGYDYINGWPTNELLRFRSQAGNGPELYEESFIASGYIFNSYCTTVNATDAQGTNWSGVPATFYEQADGMGGTVTGHYIDTNCGYMPSGYVFYYAIFDAEGLLYMPESGPEVTWYYSYTETIEAYDGTGGTYSYSNGPILYHPAGYVFYSFYDYENSQNVYFHFDGFNGYYVTYD